MNHSEKPYAGLALLTDLDGTLLMPDKTLSPVDAAAIADFRVKGGLFSIATGRGVQATQQFLALLHPDFPAVMYNGALIYDVSAEKTMYAARLPEGVGALIRELMTAFPGVGAEVLDENGVYIIQDSEIEREHLRITHVPLVYRTLGEEIDPERCLKSLFAGPEDAISEMLEYVKAPLFSAVSFTRSHRWFLEILPHDTSKGTALTKLRDTLPQGTVIAAAGDFDNDIAMLEAADFCGCPADSQPNVLRAVSGRGYLSGKTCATGFFADFIAAFTEKYT